MLENETKTQENWIAPTNPKYFDVAKYLKRNRDLVIKSDKKRVSAGDVVRVYIAAPISEIKFKGTVVESECDKDTLKKHDYISSFINDSKAQFFLVSIDTEFADGTYPYSILKENGIGQVQILARASREIKMYFKKRENNKQTPIAQQRIV